MRREVDGRHRSLRNKRDMERRGAQCRDQSAQRLKKRLTEGKPKKKREKENKKTKTFQRCRSAVAKFSKVIKKKEIVGGGRKREKKSLVTVFQTLSDVSLCPSNSPRYKDSSFTVINVKEKQKILTFFFFALI